jgi:hypothetical protein
MTAAIFPGVFKDALEAADVKGFAARKRESKKRGKLRGLGIGSYLEVTAPPNKEMGGVRFEADGNVTLITGTLDYGQGHAAPFAQVLSEKLGIPFERIKLLQGDSDELIAGGGTGGSRSITASGMAIVEASAKVIEKGKAIASHVLEASASDIEFANGRFVIAGTDRSIGIMELAQKLRAGARASRRRAAIARRQARDRPRALRLPERHPCRRSRDRSRFRRSGGGEIFLRQRFWHHRQSAPCRRPGAWRRGAGPRPGAARKHRVRYRRAIAHRLVYGLRDAARAPHLRHRFRQPSGAGQEAIRSAPRAAAKPAAPARSPRS